MSIAVTFNSVALGTLNRDELNFDYNREILQDQLLRIDGIETRNLGGGAFQFSITAHKSGLQDILAKYDWLHALPAALGNAKASLVLTRAGDSAARTYTNLLCTGFRVVRQTDTFVAVNYSFIGTAH